MNMNVREILENITKKHASDIFVVAGRPLTYKVSGKMHTYQEERMKPDAATLSQRFMNLLTTAIFPSLRQPVTTTFLLPLWECQDSVSALINSVALTPPSSESSHSLCHSQVN